MQHNRHLCTLLMIAQTGKIFLKSNFAKYNKNLKKFKFYRDLVVHAHNPSYSDRQGRGISN